MKAVLEVLSRERRARWFLLASLQSAVGTGAATVGLVIIAYDRLRSPWAITLILLAEWLPSMVAGPLFGAIADRWSRRGCAIAADVLSAGAFVGLAMVDSFGATVALALVAGVGISLFSPAILAALPSLVEEGHQAAVTSLYGAVRDAGRTVGPLLAALAFPIVGIETVMVINGATFALSALAMTAIPFGGPAEADGEAGVRRGLLAEAREGLVTAWRLAGVRVVLWASTAIVVCAAMVNVGELLLARKVGASASGFALLMVAAGGGIVIGSLLGARGGELHEMKRRYLAAVLLTGVSILGLAAVDGYAAALFAFLAMGIGNGLVVVHERLIFHATVPPRLMARAFAVLDTLTGWGYAAAFVAGGALISGIGTRGMFTVAGVGAVLVFVAAALGLRGEWLPAEERPEPGAADERPEPALGGSASGD
jgi:MFS family permease